MARGIGWYGSFQCRGFFCAGELSPGPGAKMGLEFSSFGSSRSSTSSSSSAAFVGGGSVPARILFVDDDADTRGVMVRLLRSQGYDVRAAGTCEAAIRCAEQTAIDLLITDFL